MRISSVQLQKIGYARRDGIAIELVASYDNTVQAHLAPASLVEGERSLGILDPSVDLFVVHAWCGTFPKVDGTIPTTADIAEYQKFLISCD